MLSGYAVSVKNSNVVQVDVKHLTVRNLLVMYECLRKFITRCHVRSCHCW